MDEFTNFINENNSFLEYTKGYTLTNTTKNIFKGDYIRCINKLTHKYIYGFILDIPDKNIIRILSYNKKFSVYIYINEYYLLIKHKKSLKNTLNSILNNNFTITKLN